MRPVSRAAVIRELDRRLIEDVGIPSAVLMEHAGHGVADAILARYGARRTAVLCGPGNNGGDGYVVARHLHLRGVPVVAVPVLPPRSPDCVIHQRVCANLGIVGELEAPELVVDAVFGTGQRAPLALPPLPAFEAPVVAVDVPTGIDADTGVRVGDFPAAEFVVTIGRLKPFLFTEAVPWALVDIGLEQRGEPPEAVLVDAVELPRFGPAANKWTRGHVGVLAGSPEKAGAGVMACHGALRGGAGLVTLFVARDAWSRLGALPPEVMVAEPGAYDRCDVLVVGPGLGRASDAEVRRLWRDWPKPAVFDADGIRALDGAPSPHPRLITPHAGEAAHLLGEDWRVLESDRLRTVARLGAVAPTLYKGACPLVSGAPVRVLWGGSPALAVGGSGDVLSGVCGALLVRLPPEEAAVAAAWLHQEAGRRVTIGATATEIAGEIARVYAPDAIVV